MLAFLCKVLVVQAANHTRKNAAFNTEVSHHPRRADSWAFYEKTFFELINIRSCVFIIHV